MQVRLEAAANVGTPRAARGAARPGHRAPALVALALALLAVAGLASSASAWHGTRSIGAPSTAVQAVASVGGVLLVVAFLVLWVETPGARRRKKARRALAGDELDELGASLWTGGKTAAVVLVAVALLCIATLPLLSHGSAPSHPSNVPATVIAEKGGPGRKTVHTGSLLLPIAVAVAILVPAAFLIRRRLWREEAPPTDDTAAFGRAVRASIAALESERDPRRAILRAYARMEQAFRDVEIERARDETASEFLGRTMGRLPVSAPAAAALTEHFEEARYSAHEVTDSDRAAALASLRRVERELDGRP
jgi:hypothetical protein